MKLETIQTIVGYYAQKIRDDLRVMTQTNLPPVTFSLHQPVNSLVLVIRWRINGAMFQSILPEPLGMNDKIITTFLSHAAEQILQAAKEEIEKPMLTPYKQKKKQQEQLELMGAKYQMQQEAKKKGQPWWNSNILEIPEPKPNVYEALTQANIEMQQPLINAPLVTPSQLSGLEQLMKQQIEAFNQPTKWKPVYYPDYTATPLKAPAPPVNRNPTFYDLVQTWTKDALEAAILMETQRLFDFEKHVEEGADESYVVEIYNRLKDLRNARDRKWRTKE